MFHVRASVLMYVFKCKLKCAFYVLLDASFVLIGSFLVRVGDCISLSKHFLTSFQLPIFPELFFAFSFLGRFKSFPFFCFT